MKTSHRSTAATLHEYRLRYPCTARVRTLTQSRLLWYLLQRQNQVEAGRRRRRDARLKLTASIRFALALAWRALSGEYPSWPA